MDVQIPKQIADILLHMRKNAEEDNSSPDYLIAQELNYFADKLETACREVFGEIEAEREKFLHPVSSGESVMEVIDIMYKFADRHWMHDEGQNTREFADRLKRSYLAEKAGTIE